MFIVSAPVADERPYILKGISEKNSYFMRKLTVFLQTGCEDIQHSVKVAAVISAVFHKLLHSDILYVLLKSGFSVYINKCHAPAGTHYSDVDTSRVQLGIPFRGKTVQLTAAAVSAAEQISCLHAGQCR